MKGGPRRNVRPTLLLVGEGYAEYTFMLHLKGLYVQRSSSVAVTLKNAKGKGALNVVRFAIRQSSNLPYDAVAVLLDTDTDWNDKAQAIAKKAKLIVLASRPCLEGWLLSLHGAGADGKTSSQLKEAFAQRFGGSALDASVYGKHFAKAFIEQARFKSESLAQLVALLSGQAADPINQRTD